MNVLYSKTSLKRLSKLQAAVRSGIIEAIDELPGHGDLKKMRGRSVQNLYRLRVGKYRVLLTCESETIKIVDVDTRGDIYKQSRHR